MASREKSGNICTASMPVVWKKREAKANGDEYNDQDDNARQIESSVAVRQAMWEKHIQSPVSALEEVLRKTEAGGGWAGSSTASGSST